MRIRRYPSALFAAFSFLFTLSATAVAQETQTSNVSIKNFGQMDERFFRGGQPKEEEYKALAAIGINTVIDLRNDPRSEEHTSELQSQSNLVCRLLLEKKNRRNG